MRGEPKLEKSPLPENKEKKEEKNDKEGKMEGGNMTAMREAIRGALFADDPQKTLRDLLITGRIPSEYVSLYPEMRNAVEIIEASATPASDLDNLFLTGKISPTTYRLFMVLAAEMPADQEEREREHDQELEIDIVRLESDLPNATIPSETTHFETEKKESAERYARTARTEESGEKVNYAKLTQDIVRKALALRNAYTDYIPESELEALQEEVKALPRDLREDFLREQGTLLNKDAEKSARESLAPLRLEIMKMLFPERKVAANENTFLLYAALARYTGFRITRRRGEEPLSNIKNMVRVWKQFQYARDNGKLALFDDATEERLRQALTELALFLRSKTSDENSNQMERFLRHEKLARLFAENRDILMETWEWMNAGMPLESGKKMHPTTSEDVEAMRREMQQEINSLENEIDQLWSSAPQKILQARSTIKYIVGLWSKIAARKAMMANGEPTAPLEINLQLIQETILEQEVRRLQDEAEELSEESKRLRDPKRTKRTKQRVSRGDLMKLQEEISERLNEAAGYIGMLRDIEKGVPTATVAKTGGREDIDLLAAALEENNTPPEQKEEKGGQNGQQ